MEKITKVIKPLTLNNVSKRKRQKKNHWMDNKCKTEIKEKTRLYSRKYYRHRPKRINIIITNKRKKLSKYVDQKRKAIENKIKTTEKERYSEKYGRKW